MNLKKLLKNLSKNLKYQLKAYLNGIFLLIRLNNHKNILDKFQLRKTVNINIY